MPVRVILLYMIPRLRWFCLSVALTLFLLGALNACSSTGAPGSDTALGDYARYAAAMKPTAQEQLIAMQDAPRYDLTVNFDAKTSELYGKATMLIVNSSADPWPNLLFRLYPVLQQYGGEMTIQSVAVEGRPATFVYQAENTAVQVNLVQPLRTGAAVHVQLAWKLTVPTWSNAPSVYALFGRSQQMTSLPLFYPALAVYQPGPTTGSGSWWLDEGGVRGDAAFNVASLFVVTATLPSAEVPVASGTLITSTLLDNNQARHVWVTGPVREFLLHMSPQFTSDYLEAYGTRVTSYWLPGQEAAGRAALTYAIAALRLYSDLYGDYPYRDLRIAPAPLAYRGMEYPQVELLGSELYTRLRSNLEMLVAHEVAHQWWYQLVHNDPVNEPWLDEALAEYSVKLYMEKLHSTAKANSMQRTRWQIPLNGLISKDTDTPVNESVASFTTGTQYETIIYGKGALFYDVLRQELGDRQFIRFLRAYYASHRYGIVNTKSWLADLEALSKPGLRQLYQQWVQRPTPDRAITEQPDKNAAKNTVNSTDEQK